MVSRWLERGTEICPGSKIRNLYSYGMKWQLYSTNTTSVVIAARKEQVETWIKLYSLPENVFKALDAPEIMVFVESGEYVLATLKNGPFSIRPDSIETLFLSFNRLVAAHPAVHCSQAIYLERYSLLLPTDECDPQIPNDIALGTWVSHGVGVSVFGKDLPALAPWIVGYQYSPIRLNEIKKERKQENNTESNTSSIPEDRFVLKGRPELESFFNDRILDVLKNRETYEKMGISFPGATILHGPAGSGKTYAVERFAEFLNWPVFQINSKTVGSPYIHDTSKKISEVFDEAEKNAPSVLIIDEMEAFLSQRTATEGGIHHNEEVAEFLRRIPQAISKSVLIFAMTNMLDVVDSAISRKGRFDYVLEVGLATKDEIKDVLVDSLLKLPISDKIDIPAIAEALDGRPLSDVGFVIKEAGRIAAKNRLDVIDENCMNEAVSLLPEIKKKRKMGF